MRITTDGRSVSLCPMSTGNNSAAISISSTAAIVAEIVMAPAVTVVVGMVDVVVDVAVMVVVEVVVVVAAAVAAAVASVVVAVVAVAAVVAAAVVVAVAIAARMVRFSIVCEVFGVDSLMVVVNIGTKMLEPGSGYLTNYQITVTNSHIVNVIAFPSMIVDLTVTSVANTSAIHSVNAAKLATARLRLVATMGATTLSPCVHENAATAREVVVAIVIVIVQGVAKVSKCIPRYTFVSAIFVNMAAGINTEFQHARKMKLVVVAWILKSSYFCTFSVYDSAKLNVLPALIDRCA